MTKNEMQQNNMAAQTLYTAGYEYGQAAQMLTGMKQFPESTVEVLRPAQHDFVELAATKVYDPYKLPDLIPDAFNLDAGDRAALLDFVNRYGLLNPGEYITDTGMIYAEEKLKDGTIKVFRKPDNEKRGLFEDPLNGRYSFHTSEEVAPLIRGIKLLQTCFEISNILFDECEEDKIKAAKIEVLYDISISKGMWNAVNQTYEDRMISVKIKDCEPFNITYNGSRGFSANMTVDNAFYFLASVTENALAGASFSTLHFPERVEGRLSIRRVRYAQTLRGLLWAFVSDSIGNGGHMRRCLRCGKWFRYERNKARMCSNTCRQAALRSAKKATA